MSRDEFRTVVKALITNRGKVLIGQKEDGDRHHHGEWHFIGGHVEKGEKLEEAVRREVKEETGLDVEIHQIIDANTFAWGSSGQRDSVLVLYHCEAESRGAEALDDLQDVRWVGPGDLKQELWDEESERFEEHERWSKFLEKLKKMPGTV